MSTTSLLMISWYMKYALVTVLSQTPTFQNRKQAPTITMMVLMLITIIPLAIASSISFSSYVFTNTTASNSDASNPDRHHPQHPFKMAEVSIFSLRQRPD
jgi:hypothetical protein